MIPPFWRYYGAKHRSAGAYPRPLDGAPIVEPFAGSAAYACRHGAGRDVILCDAYPVVAGLWQWLIKASRSDILDLPDVPDGGVDAMDIPPQAKWLVGYWCNNGVVSPCKNPTTWSDWSPRTRRRIADNLQHIRRWIVVPGQYSTIPNIRATWFVDPPYQGRAGQYYKANVPDYSRLAVWCANRNGRTIVCESDRAAWMSWHGRRQLPQNAGNKRSRTAWPDVVWCSEPSMIDSTKWEPCR